MFAQAEGRIKAFAIWKGKRTQEWLARRGYFAGGQLDHRDLIQASWKLLLADPNRTFASPDELRKYFTGQISGMVNNIRRSAQARYSYVVIDGAAAAAECRFVIPEDDELLACEDEYLEFEREVVLQLFETSLAARAPRLLDLMHLFSQGIVTASEQAAQLRQPVASVYRMRRQLKLLAEEFALDGANHD
jgi:hypothetical protein